MVIKNICQRSHMIGIRMGKQPCCYMTASLLDLLQYIGAVFLPSSVYHDQSAGSIFDNYGQLLGSCVMVCQHGHASGSKIGGCVCHRRIYRSKSCRSYRGAL